MRGQHISFCSFCSSCGLRETSIGVDYTQREEKDCERKKEKCMFPIIITCGSPQREEIFFRKILGGGFLNFINQNYTDFEEERLREKRNSN